MWPSDADAGAEASRPLDETLTLDERLNAKNGAASGGAASDGDDATLITDLGPRGGLEQLPTMAELLLRHCINEPIPPIRKALHELEEAIKAALRRAEAAALKYGPFLDAAASFHAGKQTALPPPTVRTLDVGCIRVDGTELWPDEESELMIAPVLAPYSLSQQLGQFAASAGVEPSKRISLKELLKKQEDEEVQQAEVEKKKDGNSTIDSVLSFLKEKKGADPFNINRKAREGKKEKEASGMSLDANAINSELAGLRRHRMSVSGNVGDVANMPQLSARTMGGQGRSGRLSCCDAKLTRRPSSLQGTMPGVGEEGSADAATVRAKPPTPGEKPPTPGAKPTTPGGSRKPTTPGDGKARKSLPWKDFMK